MVNSVHDGKPLKINSTLREYQDYHFSSDERNMCVACDTGEIAYSSIFCDDLIIEELICALGHEAGHVYNQDHLFAKPQIKTEIDADLYTRHICSKLRLDLDKCANIFNKLGREGDHHYPWIKDRILTVTQGVIPFYYDLGHRP